MVVLLLCSLDEEVPVMWDGVVCIKMFLFLIFKVSFYLG